MEVLKPFQTCVYSKDCRKHPNEGKVMREPSTFSGICCALCGRLLDYSIWPDCEQPGDVEKWVLKDKWKKIGGKFYCPICCQEYGAMTDSDEEYCEEIYCKKRPYAVVVSKGNAQ